MTWLAIAAAFALLVLVFAWRAVRDLPTWARGVARLVLVAVVLAPLALVSFVMTRSPQPLSPEIRPLFPLPGSPAAPFSTAPPPPPPPAAAPRSAPRTAETAQETGDVVPVFYGTDRAVEPIRNASCSAGAVAASCIWVAPS